MCRGAQSLAAPFPAENSGLWCARNISTGTRTGRTAWKRSPRCCTRWCVPAPELPGVLPQLQLSGAGAGGVLHCSPGGGRPCGRIPPWMKPAARTFWRIYRRTRAYPAGLCSAGRRVWRGRRPGPESADRRSHRKPRSAPGRSLGRNSCAPTYETRPGLTMLTASPA